MNNTSSVQRTSRSGRPSVFRRDLLTPSPISRRSSQKNAFGTPVQTATGTPLSRENSLVGGTDAPPPPNFTLDERLDSFPEAIGSWDYATASPESRPSPQFRSSLSFLGTNAGDPFTPMRSYSGNLRSGLGNAPIETPNTTQEAVPNYALGASNQGASQNHASGIISSSWRPLGNEGSWEVGERGGRVINMSGVVQQQQQQQQSGGLLTLPSSGEIVRPDIHRDGGFSDRVADEEEWVTVFGFSPSDTNLVFREFEKCGIILKHIPGPGDSNWMHILYQNHYDAQKALQKNGMQINGILIIGVKPTDTHQRMALSDKSNNGFMILPPHSHGRALALEPSTKMVSRPYYLQSKETTQHPTSAMASPSKSTISKIVDYMFGI
ncbi:nuclear pore complex protein NUP35 [Cryptomeria japonica]|uniref:nuclear pore complex protein NUP35 n=1 Tax=Cryptomeria japonica TaxID=3369 RepID=UPI0025ACF070|nr:nuclear pore complex protein NUP35 [Cryptomeria japonica]XP_057853344.1 nuclear pore complex protein NUP35 [Cryptomeria japonica]